MSAYDELTAQRREPEMLGKIAGRLGRGRETVMPRSAAEQRADEIAALKTCSTPAAPSRGSATGSRRRARTSGWPRHS